MFIPIFIAILMGLISPSNHRSTCTGGTVYVSSSESNAGDEPGDGGGDDSGTPGDDTGGQTGHNPPPKP
jgi:hypothetical protein